MVAIVNTKIFESIPERDGRKYVTIELTTEYGENRTYKNMLMPADADTIAKANELAVVFANQLAHEEREEAWRLAIEEGVNPANLVYKHNIKASVINDLYSKKATPTEQFAASQLSAAQNALNRIKLFLGLL